MILSGGFYLPDGEKHFTLLGNDIARYQQPQRDKAYEYVRHWRCAVDMGAHVGIFSCDFAKRFERVIAFEPMPSTRECLTRNVPANVEVQPFACGSKVEKAQMARNEQNSGGSEIVADHGAVNKPGTACVEVDVVALDGFELPLLDLLKLDVQGCEPDALLGAKQTLQRCRPVVLIEEKPMKGKGGTIDHIMKAREVLLSLGYSIRELVGADRIYTPT